MAVVVVVRVLVSAATAAAVAVMLVMVVAAVPALVTTPIFTVNAVPIRITRRCLAALSTALSPLAFAV